MMMMRHDMALPDLLSHCVEVFKHHHKVTLGDDLMPKGTVLYDFTPATDEEIPLKVQTFGWPL